MSRRTRDYEAERRAALWLAERAENAAELRHLLDVLDLNPSGPIPHRAVRVPDYEWKALGEVTKAAGTDRAKVINQFIRWYLGQPGAELPSRPADRREVAA